MIENLSLFRLPKFLQKIGIINIPVEVIGNLTSIIYYKNPGILLTTDGTHVLIASVTQMLQSDATQPILSYTYFTILDHLGNISKQISANCLGSVSISNDAKYMLCEPIIIVLGYEYSFTNAPYLLYNLKENRVDTINAPILYERDLEGQFFQMYSDSYFQILFQSNVDQSYVSLLVEPSKKVVYFRKIPADNQPFKANYGLNFKSMYLPPM